MDSQPQHPARKSTITFPNGNRSIVVNAAAGAVAAALVQTLEIKKPAAVLLLIGGADELDSNLNPQLEQLLDDGLALAAADTDALIIDGGTKAGVMALMGKVVAERGRVTQLLGIAPAGKVTYPGGPAEDSIPGGAALDPNHSHFILVDGTEWSSGTEMMFKVADVLAAEARIVAVLVNGGAEAKEEVLRCVQRGWPIVVIQGSGRLADEMAENMKLTAGNLLIFPLSGAPQDLRQLIVGHAETALLEAWRRFAQYDSNATSQQTRYRRFMTATLLLGVLGTLFALTQTQLQKVSGAPYDLIATLAILLAPIMVIGLAVAFQRFRKKGKRMPMLEWFIPLMVFLVLLILLVSFGRPRFIAYLGTGLRFLILVIPIGISVLLTASNRFKPGKKWILLRGSAEAVKKEIFCYRTRVGDYDADKPMESSPPTEPVSPDAVLAEKLATLSRRLMNTEVNTESLPYEGEVPPRSALDDYDDGMSFLTADRYLDVRLMNQLKYYQSKTVELDRQLSQFQWSIYIFGGLGTLLAALGASLWIAATTALVTAFTAYVGHLQLDPSLTKYNQTAADLSNIRAWWNATPPTDRPANKTKLVESSEKILESELTGWVQQMEEAVSGLGAAAEKEKKK